MAAATCVRVLSALNYENYNWLYNLIDIYVYKIKPKFKEGFMGLSKNLNSFLAGLAVTTAVASHAQDDLDDVLAMFEESSRMEYFVCVAEQHAIARGAAERPADFDVSEQDVNNFIDFVVKNKSILANNFELIQYIAENECIDPAEVAKKVNNTVREAKTKEVDRLEKYLTGDLNNTKGLIGRLDELQEALPSLKVPASLLSISEVDDSPAIEPLEPDDPLEGWLL